ncbi:hypothetical protein LCL89_04470 [Halobacillus yeomjeoni]|uniref:hypothetical protein n=1 Tax=Halobacillus yeomjeoni TaxID=311194 RepID=UPI001CD70126|nr:hypothetical protein [Halobacillus yeomjeoni]MCA0983302.1 hypothetical protein [Halobacillus yeomjeoni]
MSWKSVELQVALPRVLDAAKLQEQIAQRNPTMQQMISQEQRKTDEKKRQTVNEQDNVEDRRLGEESSNLPYVRNNGKKKEEQSLEHPFLGKKIDYSG